MSREAAEQEDRMRRGDDLRLQMALEESKKGGPGSAKLTKKKREPQSSLMDLMDVPEPAGARSDPWSAGAPVVEVVGLLPPLPPLQQTPGSH
ncbi:hypothetical protein CRUP_016324, partial [Coryphaenoides rupestris]